MSRFRNKATNVVFSVDDSKDGRYVDGFEPVNAPKPVKSPAKKAAAKPSDK